MLEAINYRTNQRRLVVGVDIAKEKHMASIDDGNGKPFIFFNDVHGFEVLLDRIQTSQKALGLSSNDPVVIGMEPTGHYWKALGYALKEQPNFQVVLVNPYHTKLSKELIDNSPTKSDSKDSQLIRDLTREGKTLQEHLLEGPYANLRKYFSLWNYFSIQLKGVRNRIEALLCEYFPEYEHYFFDFLGATGRSILRRYGLPWDLRDGRVSALERLIVKTSHGKITGRAQELLNLAHNTFGHEQGKKAASLELKFLLKEFDRIESFQEKLEPCMKEELALCEDGKYVLSFPGVSTVTASGFLGATGSLKRYSGYKNLEKLAGLNLVENTSGKKDKSQRHFSKRGRDDLRYVLYLITVIAICKNKEFSSLYQEKLKKHPDKERMKIVGALMAKTLRTLYALGKNSLLYNGEKILENQNSNSSLNTNLISMVSDYGKIDSHASNRILEHFRNEKSQKFCKKEEVALKV